MAPPPLSRTAPFADGIVGPPNRPFEELLQEELLLEELLQEEPRGPKVAISAPEASYIGGRK